MSAIHRKLLRDAWRLKGQSVAIALVMASGVAVFISQLSTFESLKETRDTYYADYRFADVFAQAKRVPRLVAPRLREIPGVVAIETRITLEVTLDIPGLIEPVTGRVISLPAEGRPALNDLALRRGRWLDPEGRDEVIVSEPFAQANELRLGDPLRALINGRSRDLVIVGTANSPEWIYTIRPGQMLPDNRRFGLLWMSEREVAAAFDMEGAFNDVSLAITGAANPVEVVARVDDVLRPYGGLGAYERRYQISHWFLESELGQLQSFGTVVPAIFLGVAAFLLNMVMSRTIATQREQIAALKAFGYGNGAIGRHYVGFVLLIVAAGAALGIGIGIWLGQALTQLYAELYHFPILLFVLGPRVPLLAVLITAGAAVLGTLGAVRTAVILPPADAMRPPAPPVFRRTLVERLGLERLLAQPTRMILRQLERRPWKAALSVLGIAMACAILVVGRSFVDVIDHIIDVQFFAVQREDLTVTFTEPRSRRAIHELRAIPGVRHVEPFRVVPATLRFEHRSRRASITGVPRDAQLQRVLDERLEPIPLRDDGVVLSRKLGEILGLRVGESLIVEVLEGARPVREVRVAAFVDDFMGLNATMELSALNRMMREDAVVSGAWLGLDPNAEKDVYAHLKRTPMVVGVTWRPAMLHSFQETLAKNLMVITMINIIFAGTIAFGVVYNSARISLAERARELASLRVLGLTRGEISYILLGELAVLTFLAIPLGFVIGAWLTQITIQAFSSEVLRLPFVIAKFTFAMAGTTVLAATIVSALSVRRRLDHLDLVEVLKTRE